MAARIMIQGKQYNNSNGKAALGKQVSFGCIASATDGAGAVGGFVRKPSAWHTTTHPSDDFMRFVKQ
jgi:hypothetical protein